MLRRQIPEAKVMIRNLAWHEEHRIDAALAYPRRAHRAEERVVEADGKTYPYDALLIATGGRPNPTGKPGADGAANLFPFQYLDDTRAISEQIDRSRAAVAIGGSFIAYELAEAFASRGMETHWLMRGPRGLHRIIDEEAGALLHDAATGRRRAHALRRGSRGVRSLQRRDRESPHDRTAWRSPRSATRTDSVWR